MIKVFLSSTSRDLVEFRHRAEKAINSLDGFHCIAMENFGARDATAAEYCPDLVAECEVIVLLLGPTYGSCPTGSTLFQANYPAYTALTQDQRKEVRTYACRSNRNITAKNAPHG